MSNPITPSVPVTETFDRKLAHEAQRNYCKGKNAPHFAPADKCWSCGQHIYDKISVERAGAGLITGCPYCCKSYCD